MTEHFPVIDEIDHSILMHREAHFGGLFSEMIDYYRAEKKGVQPEFTLKRIEELAALEAASKENLAPLLLSGEEAEKVGDSKAIYKNLRDIYDVDQPKLLYPQLIADLILSEDEEPHKEIEAIIEQKQKIVPWLIDVLKKQEFNDPLFPGYGYVHDYVVECLGKIGDKKAIISLFEEIGQGDFFADDQIVHALYQIGDSARDFLLRVLEGKPLNEDNEKAAIALVCFQEDPLVSAKCLDLLEDPQVVADLSLSIYLILVCAGLKDPEKRARFRSFSESLPKNSPLRQDAAVVMRKWENPETTG